jgi:hypothetical protein
VVFRTGEDIARIGELDQKLWVALACPTRGIDFDPRTLDLIDADHDGRVRPPEVVAACEWVCARLRNPDVLLQGSDVLTLGDLDGEHARGRAPARRGAPPAADPGQARGRHAHAGRHRRPRRAAGRHALQRRRHRHARHRAHDDAVRATHRTTSCAPTAACPTGTRPHPASTARAPKPSSEVQVARDWHAQADAGDTTLMPLGEPTLAAADAANKVQAKLDDFFARCRVAAFDAQAVTALNPSEGL